MGENEEGLYHYGRQREGDDGGVALALILAPSPCLTLMEDSMTSRQVGGATTMQWTPLRLRVDPCADPPCSQSKRGRRSRSFRPSPEWPAECFLHITRLGLLNQMCCSVVQDERGRKPFLFQYRQLSYLGLYYVESRPIFTKCNVTLPQPCQGTSCRPHLSQTRPS